MNPRQRKIRPFLAALVMALGLTAVGPALAAAAAPVAAAPVAAKACAEAPEPNRPTSGLAGKMYTEPGSVSSANPFTNPGVPIADVYGYSYKWQNYDNGCLPGSGAVADFNTSVGNMALGTASAVHAFTHGLLNLVVVPDWLSPLDGVLTSTTSAVKAGFWTPWVGIVMLLVAVSILWAATRANTSAVVTSTCWALLALVATTYVMSYPVSSAQAVDGLIQETVTVSAKAAGKSAAGTGEVLGPAVPTETTDTGNDASNALNSMFDRLNRENLYDAWLEGTLGSSTSKVATDHGPDLFRASHLTWAEAATVEADPTAGQAIIDAKKELWTTTAAAVERADSAAYAQLTGNNGRWSAAGIVVVTTAFLMPFLAVAAVFLVLAYVATRAFIPLAPAIGVIALLHISQGWVITVLKNVGRFIILGPLFWMAALVNLAIASAVLGSSLAWLIKLAICVAIPILLFKLLKPGQSIPGVSSMRRMMRMGAGAMLLRGAVRPKGNGDDPNFSEPRRQPDWDQLRNRKYDHGHAPVAQAPAGPALAMAPERRAIAAGRVADQQDAASSAARLSSAGAPRELAAAGATNQLGPGRTREVGAGRAGRRRALSPAFRELPAQSTDAARELDGPSSTTQDTDQHRPAGLDLGERTLAGGGRHPALAPGSGDDTGHRTSRPVVARPEEDLSAPATKTTPPPTIMRGSESLPSGIVEANVRTVDGAEVFEIWQPPTTAKTGTDHDEEYR